MEQNSKSADEIAKKIDSTVDKVGFRWRHIPFVLFFVWIFKVVKSSF